jgi:hypothetical protein
MPPFLQTLVAYWRRFPFRHVLLMTIFLSFWSKEKWGEQYPFTDFPMYSHLDAESDVLYVTNQKDEVLPFHTLFGTKTSTQKKTFINELAKITNADNKRDSRDAKPEERQAAGEKMTAKLMPKLKEEKLPAGTQSLRFYYKVFRSEDGKIVESSPQLIAEKTVAAGA